MISSNPYKCLCIILLALALCSSCRFFQSNGNSNVVQDTESEINTNIPFSTKEPEVFQAEFIVSNYVNGKKTERTTFIAQKGKNKLTTYQYGAKNELTFLQNSDDKSFRINHSEKTIQKRNGTSLIETDSAWQGFLSTRWLNDRKNAKFEKVGTENNLTKYLVRLEDAENSETFVFVDEKINIPVKYEVYQVTGEKKDLTYAVEVKNFKTEVEDKIFELPKDYQEIDK
jgi:hypothetical protein